jgi:hypothetical protein
MVEHILGKVAVKVISSNGLGYDIKGVIVDNDDKEITKFETNYLGMGSFLINPSALKTYSAKFKMGNDAEQAVILPKVEKSGYAMMAYDIDSATIGVKISISNDLLNKGELNFISHHDGKPYTVATVPTSAPASLIALNRKELPSGILQLILFSPASLPVCERLVFINNRNDSIKLQLQDLKTNYSKREAVALSLITNPDKPVWADFSVAVTNTSAVMPDEENESNILTTLLLTSDLTGYVEKPNHYFLKNDAKTKAELDQLLLTQGWRKINWTAATDSQPQINFQAEKALNISGQLSINGQPMAKNKITLLSKSNGLTTLDTLSDEQGRFLFKDLSFKTGTKFALQAKIKKDKNVVFKLDSITQQPITSIDNLGDIEVNVNEKLKPYLTENTAYLNDLTKRGIINRSIRLKEVSIVGERLTPAKNSSNLNGPGNADYVLDVSNLSAVTSLDIFLQGRIPSIAVRGGVAINLRKPGNIGDTFIDKHGKKRIVQDTMNVVIDGVFVGGDYNIRMLDPSDLESVEVLLSLSKLAIYGDRAKNGLLIITTKRGGAPNGVKEEAPGIITFSPRGYDVPREFYSPKYGVEASPAPDLRNTIYWKPDLMVDEKGIGKFNYFNSDQSGTYRIVIEGIDAFGNLARKVYTYQVK